MAAADMSGGLEGQDGNVITPEMPLEPAPETFWSKLGRFLRGLFGLGSGEKQVPADGSEIIPTEEFYPSRPGKG